MRGNALKKKNLAITKTPYRICLTGASDLIPYVKRYGGSGFSATINKFVTVVANRREDKLIILSYPDGYEIVEKIEEIRHPIIRESLSLHRIEEGFSISSFSDIPIGSGLGASGAFTVGLLNALYGLQGIKKSPKDLAEEAADIEINRLKAPIGKHDHYMAAFGGFIHLIFEKNGNVQTEKLNIPKDAKQKLEENMKLVFSGMRRSASKVLSITDKRFQTTNLVFEDIHRFKEIGHNMMNLVACGKIDEFALGLDSLMEAKNKCFVSCFNSRLGNLVETGRSLGAIGYKVIGAGGGGFIYFYVPKKNQKKFKKGITKAGGTIYDFSFVDEGSQLIA